MTETYVEGSVEVKGYVEGLNEEEGYALKQIPKLIEEQNKLIREQNIAIERLIETIKWLK